MAIPAKNVLGNPNVTEGNYQIAIEQLRESVVGSGKAYDAANTYSQYDTCVSGGIVYYSKINSNTGNTPAVNANWGLIGDLITGIVHNVGNESIDGIKTFITSPIVPTPTTTGNVITMDNIIQKTPVAIGYEVGAGGTVTQLTNKSTAVTLNKPSGQITMNNAALASNVKVPFLLYNSIISSYDNIHITVTGGSTVLAQYEARGRCSGGVAEIVVSHTYGGTLEEPIILTFTVLKGANS